MPQDIIVTGDGPIATIRLNRPGKLNAFSGSMREEILEAFHVFSRDDRIHVVVVTGEGRGFSAGGDIDYLRQLKNRPQVIILFF